MTDWCIVVIANDQRHLFIGACQHPVERLHDLRKLNANTRLIIQATVPGLERSRAVKIENRVHEMLRAMRVTNGTGLKWYAGVTLEQMKSTVLKAREEVVGRDGRDARRPQPQQSQQTPQTQPQPPQQQQQDRKPLPIYVTDGYRPPRQPRPEMEQGFVLDLDKWMRE